MTRAAQNNGSDADLRRGVLGIVTARGGSKGVPGKNIAEVGGKPLLAWTVEKARKSGAVERLIVSTDDPVIADVARRAGAETPFLRPQSLAADDTPHLPVIQHALAREEAQGRRPSHVVVLQPTSPLVLADDIAACVHLAKARGAAAVISVTRFHGHPSWLMRIEPDGRLARWQECAAMAEQRQNGAAAFVPNGAVYVLSADLVRKGDDWYGTSTLAYEMPPERALDIDDAWDLHLTRLLFAYRA
jgi:CMP-N,N'-diacetyllegionaminic acid synthase